MASNIGVNFLFWNKAIRHFDEYPDFEFIWIYHVVIAIIYFPFLLNGPNLQVNVIFQYEVGTSRPEEVQMSLAGVEMNLLVAGICLLLAMQCAPLSLVLVRVANLNVVLAGINLLPASGLDGEAALSALFEVNSISDVAKRCLFNRKHRQKLLHAGFPGYACCCVFALTMLSGVVLWLIIGFNFVSVICSLF